MFDGRYHLIRTSQPGKRKAVLHTPRIARVIVKVAVVMIHSYIGAADWHQVASTKSC